MWIRRLTLTNFRGFASLDLDLDRPLTVLVGVNGSGKSSVLRALVACQTRRLTPGVGWRDRSSTLLDPRDLRVGAAGASVVADSQRDSGTCRYYLEWNALRREWIGGVQLGPSHLDVRREETVLFVGAARRFDSAAVSDVALGPPAAEGETDDASAVAIGVGEERRHGPPLGYEAFLAWFKDREDAENAERVQKRDLDLQHPQLRAVREAVAELMPGFANLRIARDPSPAMVVTKAGVELRLDQLSDGERSLIALAGDLARRLVIAHPEHPSPREVEAVILIDEIEQHLHPALQRRVIPSLQRAFPRAQLIVTTHSPQVLSSVPASSVVVLDRFEALSVAAPTAGRDTNAILREVFGVSERPEEEVLRIRAIADLVDESRLDEARDGLRALADKLSEADDDVQRLRTRLDFAEAGL